MILLIDNHAIPSDAIVDVKIVGIQLCELIIVLIGGTEISINPNVSKLPYLNLSEEDFKRYCAIRDIKTKEQLESIDPQVRFLKP
jgi:hypothetical protein